MKKLKFLFKQFNSIQLKSLMEGSKIKKDRYSNLFEDNQPKLLPIVF